MPPKHPNDPHEKAINALLGISLVLIIMLFFMLFGVGCAGIPPVPNGIGRHKMQPNKVLSTWEIRLRGHEETVIVGKIYDQDD